MMIKKYVDMKGLCEHTTLSRGSIYNLLKNKEANFPRAYTFKHIKKRVFWLVEEVDTWVENNVTKQETA